MTEELLALSETEEKKMREQYLTVDERIALRERGRSSKSYRECMGVTGCTARESLILDRVLRVDSRVRHPIRVPVALRAFVADAKYRGRNVADSNWQGSRTGG